VADLFSCEKYRQHTKKNKEREGNFTLAETEGHTGRWNYNQSSKPSQESSNSTSAKQENSSSIKLENGVSELIHEGFVTSFLTVW